VKMPHRHAGRIRWRKLRAGERQGQKGEAEPVSFHRIFLKG